MNARRRTCAAVVAVAGLLASPHGAAHAGDGRCTRAERRAELAQDQAAVLELLGAGTETDLTRLDDEADVAALAELGWSVPPHQQTSVRGMGWALANPDELESPRAGRPPLVTYRPTPPGGAVNTSVTDPRDGFDFPYLLAGWAYFVTPYDVERHPGVFRCLTRADWFVHERGVHPFDDGSMIPVPPSESIHGTAPGADSSPVLVPGRPGIDHTRAWDVHLWLGDDGVPLVSMLNPGQPIPGIDPLAGTSPPAPGEPPPAFFHPIDPRNELTHSENCDELAAFFEAPYERVRAEVPEPYVPIDPDTPGGPFAEVFVRSARCDAHVFGTSRTSPAHFMHVSATIASPDQTGGLHFYTFFQTSDDDALARWLQKVAPGYPVQVVSGYGWSYDGGAPADANVRLVVPPPADAPLEMSAQAGARVAEFSGSTPGVDLSRFTFWTRVRNGTAKLVVTARPETMGPLAGELWTTPENVLSRMLGTTYHRFGVPSVAVRLPWTVVTAEFIRD